MARAAAACGARYDQATENAAVVRKAAELVGQTLGASGLWERDITVLTLHRGTNVFPNPRKGQLLEAEDRLLCFGKLEEMRGMIPERKKRRARVRKLPKTAISDVNAPRGSES